MDSAKKERLQKAGVNLASAMQRFMNNEAMVEKYLTRFPTEKSYLQLREAIEAGDREAAAIAVHSLKSVCGTLGFEKMQGQVIAQEAAIRGGKWEEAVAMMPEIEAEFQRLSNAIQG